MYQSDYTAGSGGQIFPSPGQSGGSVSRPDQSYYTRGSVRGMARGGKGLAQTFRSSGWHRGIYPLVGFSPLLHFPPLLLLDICSGSGVVGQSCHILAKAWAEMNLTEVVVKLNKCFICSSGGSYIPQTHFRDSGPLLYAARVSNTICALCCVIVQWDKLKSMSDASMKITLETRVFCSLSSLLLFACFKSVSLLVSLVVHYLLNI